MPDDDDLRNEPNEAGFAGGATTPEPEPEARDDPEHERAERAAIPGDDLTTALGEAVSDDSD